MAKPKKLKLPVEMSFEELFKNRLNKIEADAQAAGSNMSLVCKAARVARASPTRWRHEVPNTIKLIDRMSAVVEKLTKNKAARG